MTNILYISDIAADDQDDIAEPQQKYGVPQGGIGDSLNFTMPQGDLGATLNFNMLQESVNGNLDQPNDVKPNLPPPNLTEKELKKQFKVCFQI